MKEGWEVKKLGDVCEILDYLRKPVTKKDRREGIYPYYGASGIQDYVDSYIFDGRYLLVGEDGAKWGASDKSAYIIEGKSWVNNHAHILKVNDEIIDKLIEYYLVFKDLSEYITGAIVPKLTQQALRSIPIPIPPLSEQSRIVEELDQLSNIIEKKRQQLSELDNLAQSIFYDMFGDPVTNKKGLEVKKLGDVCKSDLGKTLNQSKDKGEYHHYLCAVNILWGYINLNNLKQARFENIELEKYSLQKGDLLICEGGDVGRAAIWNENKPMLYQNALHRVRFDKSILAIYALYWLQWLKNNGELDKYVKGVTIKHLVKSSLLSIPICIPSFELQQLFAQKIEAIEKEKELIKQSIKETEELFNSRMDYYFN